MALYRVSAHALIGGNEDRPGLIRGDRLNPVDVGCRRREAVVAIKVGYRVVAVVSVEHARQVNGDTSIEEKIHATASQ
jgi:hypothetical protein